MRGAPAKLKEPTRQTRSGVAGKMVVGTKAGASGRPKRATAKPKVKAKPKKKPPPTPLPAEKKQPKQTKAAPKKTSNKQKEQREKDKEKHIKEEEIKAEPVEVVIQVKKQRTKKKTEPAKMGVAAGKVGKRKGKQGQTKKETLKKVGKSADKDDLVNTIVQVAVVKKVLPSPKPETKRKEKAVKKEKPEKKKVDKDDKKEKEDKIKKEPKEEKKPKEGKKEIKLEKKIKEEPNKEERKDIKEDKFTKQHIKEEKGAKEERAIKEEKHEKVAEDKKKTIKPKSKSKERKECKKADESKPKEEEIKPMKTKVKLEKISPITVQEDIDMDSPTPSPPPVPKNARNTFSAKAKAAKSVRAVKEPPPKKEKVFKKRPGRKPAIKIKKEEPVFLEKRHREASLNALAKVHCLYENESRGAMNEMLEKNIRRKEEIKIEKIDPSYENEDDDEPEVEEKPSRTLRSAPGMRGMGRHWDILNAMSTSSSSDDEIEKIEEESSKDEAEEEAEAEDEEEQPKEEKKPEEKKTRKSRKRTELMMDLKDMVVRKRMASLNASAMMAASYSVERRGSGDKRRSGRSSDDSTSSAVGDSSDDEVIVSGTSKKVAVIVNQDTDLTITGLYTTRSTRHEGYCSIAGMQYRISSTSHTQTEATAVSTETVIHTTDHVSVSHSESGGSVEAGGTSSPGGSCKSYTPLGALSSMQPPGQGRPCGSSAFSAPPYHPHPQELHEYAEEYEPKYCPPERARNFIGYYQPAGPLISHGGGGPPSASGTTSTSKSATPEPYPPHPYPSYPAYDYPGYYGRGYRRPWASTSQMMTDYLEPTYPPPPHPNYYHYPPPPPPTAAPPAPPVCYTSLVRPPFIDSAAFQCPCPMQSSCPKNVLTGPLTGASKRSEPEAQTTELTTLLPVALALPPEPTGASPGPPSPARGSAGMPPPASPALSTARNNRWSPPEAGLIKPVTPPPAITVVESPPPPAATPPTLEHPPPCKRRNKRAASDTSEIVRKRKKANISVTKQNKNKVNKIAMSENEEDKNENNNNITNNNCKKVAELPLRRTPSLRWSNGWSWEGEPYTAKVFLTTEDPGAMRTCYPAMRHREGDVIKPRDCILLKSSGPRKALPFVAKVSAMWENPDDHEMMVSVLWYYRPEHTEQGRTDDQPIDEIFASRHKDTNSVACIEDKCFVLTFHEYCRYRKSLIAGGRKMNTVVPPPSEGYPRADQLPPGQVASDLVFFCRQVYDFRQKKILKKPPSQSSSRT